MPRAKYQFEDDFLVKVSDEYKSFVTDVHKMLLAKGYKVKIQVTKSMGLRATYSQPKIKTVKGIILYFFFRDDKLMIRIDADNHEKYPDVLNRLPEGIISQIDQANDCVKFADPKKCWQGCIGYDFHIRGKNYQKCYAVCFQFEVDSESIPFLLEMIEYESKERCAV